MSVVLTAADILDTFRQQIKQSLSATEARKKLKPVGRFTIVKGYRSTRRYLSEAEAKVLKAEGWKVDAIETRQVEDHEARLIKSMGHVIKGAERAARPKKFAGCLRVTPASIRTHVVVRQHKADGSHVDHLIPRSQFFPQEVSQNV